MVWHENIGIWRKPSVREANRVLAPLHSHHEAYLGAFPPLSLPRLPTSLTPGSRRPLRRLLCATSPVA